jgi:flagellar biosynthesis/type III secretory pathway protein FliH
MSLPRGRIVRGRALGHARAIEGAAVAPSPSHAGRLLKSALADAVLAAGERLAAAEAKARAIVAQAEEAARSVRERAVEEAQKEALARLSAAWIRLRTEEARRDERSVERLVELARAMAERLLGEALRLAPETVLAIARQVLASASQARRIAFRAHPDDADVIRREIAALGLEQVAVEIHADAARPRGSLLLDTDLGMLDANLTIALDRLARALRDSFRL